MKLRGTPPRRVSPFYTFKFIIIGDASVGKSCIMRQFIDQRFASDYPHTIGVEYGTKIGLALRGEVEAFEKDAMLASVAVFWRLGRGSDSGHGGLFSKMSRKNAMESMMGSADDTDSDGVPNCLDDCPDTAPGEPVTATGCDVRWCSGRRFV